jgi:SAM-dependent methyltransferase
MKTGFDALADTYDERIAGAGRNWTVDQTIRAAQSVFPVRGTVLDIGCGTGLYTRTLSSAGARVVGIDNSLPMLKAAIKAASLRYACVDCARPLPFPDATFDCVTAFDVLVYIPDLDGVYSEVNRIMKPGGVFFLVVANAKSIVRRIARAGRLGGYGAGGPPERHSFFTKTLLAGLQRTFKQAGVRVIRPVPGFASGAYTQAPSLLKPLFSCELIGLGLLAWGRKA